MFDSRPKDTYFSGKMARPAGFLLAVLLLGLALGGRVRPAAAQDAWWDPSWHFRHEITVNADGFARTDKPVEVKLNFTPLLAAQGGSGAFGPDSIRVIEIDGGGAVIDAAVPFQFDRAADYDAATRAHGTLTFILKGATGATATRRYHVYFDTAAAGHPPANVPAHVTLTDGVGHKGYPSLRIVTAAAEYFYHKPGGGFATLLDRNAIDWINWNTAAGGAGDFRGIPNMVHPNDGGYFHPGRSSVTTTVLDTGPLHASFKSTSANGAWAVQWDIFPGYARMTVLKAPAIAYWFLYEGVPGGALQPAIDRMTRSDGNSIPASGTWTTDIPGDEWVFATDPNAGGGRSLFLAHHQDDTKIDGYYADGSNMTVFGFGRSANQRLLTGLPRQFTFGFVDATTLNAVRPAVNDAYKPLAITGANDDGTPPPPVCNSRPQIITFSPKGNITVKGVAMANEDVIRYDANTCTFAKVFDGTDAGLPAASNIDALAVIGSDYYLSFAAPLAVPGIAGTVDDSDIVRWNGSAFSMYLDGSAFGLSTSYEDVDAVAFDETGALLVSTLGAYSVPGAAGQNEDLIRFNGATWQLRFDGSHNGGLAAEDVAGASVTPNGDIYLSVIDGFATGGIRGNGLDIFRCVPSSLGAGTTSCAYNLFWDAGEAGMPAFDAIDIQ